MNSNFNVEMFSTLPKPFYLPSYVGGLAQVFAKVPSPIPVCTQRYNSRILDFVDVKARQGDKSDGSSSRCV